MSFENTMYADTFVGAKADQLYDAAEISRAVKKELKAMQKAGQFPAEIKFSVTSNKYSMGQAVDVVLSGWETEQVYDKVWSNFWECVVKEIKPEAKEILEKVEVIRNQYNREAINAQIDYFNVNYYGSSEWSWKI